MEYKQVGSYAALRRTAGDSVQVVSDAPSESELEKKYNEFEKRYDELSEQLRAKPGNAKILKERRDVESQMQIVQLKLETLKSTAKGSYRTTYRQEE